MDTSRRGAWEALSISASWPFSAEGFSIVEEGRNALSHNSSLAQLELVVQLKTPVPFREVIT